jgi:hypothetical protein
MQAECFDAGMLDVTGAKGVEIVVSRHPDGAQVIHVNTEKGCKLRICRIEGDVTLTVNCDAAVEES